MKKNIILIIPLILIGAVLYFGYNPKPKLTEEQKQIIKEYEEIEKAYYEDEYGGETAEETWQMFLDALKNEDVELASKYFAVDKQEQWLNDLNSIKNNAYLGEMLVDLTSDLEVVTNTDEKVVYMVGLGTKVAANVVFIKNANNKWKIRTL